MKSVVASLALIGSALAAGGADGVNQVLTQIAGDLKEFDTAIKGYDGKSTDTLLAASNKIQSTTTSGAAAIAGGPDLSLTDAVGITSNVQSLQTTLDSTLSDLKGIADKLAAGGQCSTILEQLASQGKGAQALQDAITNKAPTETKAVASQLGGAIGASIEDTNAYFKKACANAPSGGASSGASSGGAAAGGAAAGAGAGAAGAGAAPAGGDMGSMPGMGSTPTQPKSQGGSSGSSGSSGTKTNKGAKTSAPAKPAQYTGAAASLTAPIFGALALAFFAL